MAEMDALVVGWEGGLGETHSASKGYAESDRDCPMDGRRDAGPGEDQLANRGQNRANTHYTGGCLRGNAACLRVFVMRVDDLPPDRLHEYRDQCPDPDPDEGQARLSWPPAALLLEHDGVCHETLFGGWSAHIGRGLLRMQRETELTRYRIP